MHRPIHLYWYVARCIGLGFVDASLLTTALSDDNNNDTFLIICWDVQGSIVKGLAKPGARYVWQIAYNTNTQVFTFTGQARASVTATFAELTSSIEHVAPVIGTINQSLLPDAPDNWKYTNLTDPNQLGSDSAHYPVLLYDAFTFTGEADNPLLLATSADRHLLCALSLQQRLQ